MCQQVDSTKTNCLRKYRKERRLEQKDVAKILGLKNASRISRWENGVCFPNAENLFRLAALYHVLVEALLPELMHQVRHEVIEKEEAVLPKQTNETTKEETVDKIL